MEIDKLKLLMGRPIAIDPKNNIYVRQPLIKEIIDIGEDEFNKLILPFTLTVDAVFNGLDNADELAKKFNIFELFFIKIDEEKTILDKIFRRDALELLKNGISFFIPVDDIRILENRHKMILNNSYIVDDKTFLDIRKVIQMVVGKTDMEVEKPPKNMTKRQRDIWMKLQAGRRRTAERNAIYLQDMINYVSFGGSSYIPPKQIEEMTYYFLLNAYKSVVGLDAYRTGMGYKLSPKFDVKDEVRHWTETLKIGK